MSEPLPSNRFKQIFLFLLLFAGVVIAALCYYKITRKYQPVDIESIRPIAKRNAPLFELYDYHKPQERVRLATYLGRHRILLVFFDGQRGCIDDPILKELRNYLPQLKSTSTKVIAIGDVSPQINRAAIRQYQEKVPGFQFPFLLLSDFDNEKNPQLACRVRRMYGMYDEQTKSLQQGLFIIDRSGQIEWMQTGPKQSLSTPSAIQKLLKNP